MNHHPPGYPPSDVIEYDCTVGRPAAPESAGADNVVDCVQVFPAATGRHVDVYV
jgi:hypothetical protein